MSTELRLKCMELAIHTPGNPNHIQQAQAYYDWVTASTSSPQIESNVTKPQQGGKKGK